MARQNKRIILKLIELFENDGPQWTPKIHAYIKENVSSSAHPRKVGALLRWPRLFKKLETKCYQGQRVHRYTLADNYKEVNLQSRWPWTIENKGVGENAVK